MLRFIGGFNQTQSRKHLHRPDRCIYPLSVGGVRNRVYLRILLRAPRLLQVLEHLTESHFVQKFCFLGPSQNTAGQRCGNEIDELFTPHTENSFCTLLTALHSLYSSGIARILAVLEKRCMVLRCLSRFNRGPAVFPGNIEPGSCCFRPACRTAATGISFCSKSRPLNRLREPLPPARIARHTHHH